MQTGGTAAANRERLLSWYEHTTASLMPHCSTRDPQKAASLAREVDQLLWQGVSEVSQWPSEDLFPHFGFASIGTPTPAPTPEPTPTPEPADECVRTANADGTITGNWSSDCDSKGRSGSYASYHTFTLAESADVTITAESSVDTYLFLREGSGRDGTELASNDDHADESDCIAEFERSTDSCIVHSLAAGTYTIEVTTYDSGTAGDFTLTVSGLPLSQ